MKKKGVSISYIIIGIVILLIALAIIFFNAKIYKNVDFTKINEFYKDVTKNQ